METLLLLQQIRRVLLDVEDLNRMLAEYCPTTTFTRHSLPLNITNITGPSYTALLRQLLSDLEDPNHGTE